MKERSMPLYEKLLVKPPILEWHRPDISAGCRLSPHYNFRSLPVPSRLFLLCRLFRKSFSNIGRFRFQGSHLHTRFPRNYSGIHLHAI